MASPIRSLACNMQGHLVALRIDGTLYLQKPAEGSSERKEWVEVDLNGIDDRVVEVVSRPSGYPGPLIVRTASGALYEQYSKPRDRYGVYRWRLVELPA